MPSKFLQINWFSKKYSSQLQKILPKLVKNLFVLKNAIVIKTIRFYLPCLLIFLNKHSLCLFDQLIDIAAEDTPKRKERFRINYILTTILYNTKMIVSATTDELTYLPSVIKIFASAGWLEREVWDLFGIYFTGNIDLRRILTDYGFPGHPLRKDFPLSGFTEVYYALDKKKIVTVPVEFAQEYRVFTL